MLSGLCANDSGNTDIGLGSKKKVADLKVTRETNAKKPNKSLAKFQLPYINDKALNGNEPALYGHD